LKRGMENFDVSGMTGLRHLAELDNERAHLFELNRCKCHAVQQFYRSVGRIPNMLAPLFGRQAALNSYYPSAVLEYLRSVPPSGVAADRSRLGQLMSEWKRAGWVGQPDSAKTRQQITRLTSSMDDKTKLSIDDLSDRMAMLGDVTGLCRPRRRHPEKSGEES